ncbi:hypothetical protein [Nostoc sp.]
MGSGEEAFSGCTDFFQKSNTSPILTKFGGLSPLLSIASAN